MKRLILVVMLVAGCGGTDTVSAAGAWHSSFQGPTGTMTLTMSIAQDEAGILTGPAILNTDVGLIDGQINGRENAYVALRFPNTTIIMQLAGLPTRMFGSVYIDGSATVVEFAKH